MSTIQHYLSTFHSFCSTIELVNFLDCSMYQHLLSLFLDSEKIKITFHSKCCGLSYLTIMCMCIQYIMRDSKGS